MINKRSILIAILMVCTLSALPVQRAHADSNTGSTSKAEKSACSNADYHVLGSWNLRNGGKSHDEIGTVEVSYRPSPSDPSKVRVCAVTMFGSKTYGGKKRAASVTLSTEAKGGGDRTRRYWDTGTYNTFAGGVAITPSKGRCAVISGYIKYEGKKYRVTVDQNDVGNKSLLCN